MEVTSYNQTGQVAGIRATNQKFPLGGDTKALSYKVLVSPGTPTSLDVTNNMSIGQIDQIQAVFIDNSAGAATFTLLNNNNGMMVECPAGSQMWCPIIAGYPPQSFTCNGNGIVPVFLINVPMPIGQLGTQAVSAVISGTVDVIVIGTATVVDTALITAVEAISETLPNGVVANTMGPPAITPADPVVFKVTTGGVAVTVFNATELNVGGVITNPYGATESLFVDIVNTPSTAAPGTNGTTFELVPGQSFVVPGNIKTAVEANAITSGHSFTAVVL